MDPCAQSNNGHTQSRAVKFSLFRQHSLLAFFSPLLKEVVQFLLVLKLFD
jgi:hypothetical protein